MPAEAPGSRESVIATKATTHGKAVVEYGIPGQAAKSTQALPAYPSVANALAAQQIGVGEEFVIMTAGRHTFDAALTPLPGAAVAGADLTRSALYIRHSDNSLVLAATALAAGVLQAGFSKFGLLIFVDTVFNRYDVNLNLRSTF